MNMSFSQLCTCNEIRATTKAPFPILTFRVNQFESSGRRQYGAWMMDMRSKSTEDRTRCRTAEQDGRKGESGSKGPPERGSVVGKRKGLVPVRRVFDTCPEKRSVEMILHINFVH